MPSGEIHHLGIELERTIGYLQPDFPESANNSANYYDYGNGLLFGVAIGTGAMHRKITELSGPRHAGSALVNAEIALQRARDSMAELENDPTFSVHDHPRCMAAIVRLLHACTALHAAAAGKPDYRR